MTDAPVVFSAHALCKVYRSGEVEVQALRDVDMEIRRGEFVVLLGASDSGKSTLLNILGRLDVPSSGEVRFGDPVLGQLIGVDALVPARMNRVLLRNGQALDAGAGGAHLSEQAIPALVSATFADARGLQPGAAFVGPHQRQALHLSDNRHNWRPVLQSMQCSTRCQRNSPVVADVKPMAARTRRRTPSWTVKSSSSACWAPCCRRSFLAWPLFC